MDIQQLKDACNKNYAQAIEGLERGAPQKDVCLRLLDAAELLIKISAADCARRAECEAKAAKLLAAAKKLRAAGDVRSVYKELTGRSLPAYACSAGGNAEGVPPRKDISTPKDAEAEDCAAAPFAVAADTSARQPQNPGQAATPEGTKGEPDALPDDDAPGREFPGGQAENSENGGPEKQAGKSNLEELKGLIKSGGGRSGAYGKEDTAGYRFAWDDIPRVSFDDVAGLDDVKEVVYRKVLLPLKNPELYEGYVKKNGGGLLLYGPPGTGKTMIAAAIAHEIGAKFCSLGPSDLVLGGIGNSEKACVTLFKEARSFSCAVLFFDEIESICPVNTQAQGARQLRSELLRQIQGMEAYGNRDNRILFLIAATNKPWDIDPAFVRPGRFGTRIYVGLPDSPARKYMLQKRMDKIMQTGKVAVGDIDYGYIVEKTEGFNGADIANLLDEVQELSALRSAKSGVKEILQEDFGRALNKITSSVQEKDMQKLRAWREQNG